MKTTKLTTNQIRFLREAVASHTGRVHTTIVGGHGPYGGVLRGGYRDGNAMCKLRDMGLVTFEGHDHQADASRGWTARYTTATWLVTDAGRAAVGALDAVTKDPANESGRTV
jgi:hypothetical protein